MLKTVIQFLEYINKKKDGYHNTPSLITFILWLFNNADTLIYKYIKFG